MILDTAMNDTRAKVLICIFLMVATFCIYSQIQDHEFINFDDDKYITNNLNVQAGLTSESFKWAFTTSHPPYWHPMTWLSHMLDYQLYGLHPKGHYLTNLFLHISSVLILFIVLLRMTGALWQSAFVAALFALHPLNVESVAWIAERKNVLSTLFWLITMWAYIYYTEKPTVKRYGLVFLFFTLGLMSKPMLVTLPFVLLLLDYWPLRRFQFGQERGRNEILEKKTAVVSFLDGYAKKILNPNDCYEVGINTAKLHLITKDLSGKRENKLSINSWRKIYNKVKKDCSKIHSNLPKVIEKNLDKIEKNWPKNIPSGIIHADLFPDNIFFKDDKLTGVIDFYFSCYDFYVFEIAICLNALCFEGQKENLSFNVTKAKKFIDGYSSIKKLTEEEKKSLKILCQGAAMRFLLTRVFDYLNLTEGALVKIKDPIEYLKRLEFHNSVKNYHDYFF